MKKSFEQRIAINNATIARNLEVIEAQEALWKAYRNKEITWDEYHDRAYASAGYCIKDRAERIVSDLEMWNAMLKGEKVYFNGSYYSDIHPYEVIEVFNAGKVLLREMKATAAGEFYTNQWNIESYENGVVEVANIRETLKGVKISREGDKHYTYRMSTEPHYYYDYTL